MDPIALRRLTEESFGQKLRRARLDSGVEFRDVAALVSAEATFVSHSSIRRLESLDEPPRDVRRRVLACLAALAYGFDPTEFGLSIEDLPRNLDVDRFLALSAASRPDGEAVRAGRSVTHRYHDAPGQAA